MVQVERWSGLGILALDRGPVLRDARFSLTVQTDEITPAGHPPGEGKITVLPAASVAPGEGGYLYFGDGREVRIRIERADTGTAFFVLSGRIVRPESEDHSPE